MKAHSPNAKLHRERDRSLSERNSRPPIPVPVKRNAERLLRWAGWSRKEAMMETSKGDSEVIADLAGND